MTRGMRVFLGTRVALKRSGFARFSLATLLVCCLSLIGVTDWLKVAHAQSQDLNDIVLQGGRVMDPDTGLDAVRNVGIRGDRIVEISEEPLRGREVVNVSGLVVSPGFIDLHAHGQTNEANEFQAHDGVTTALELEGGRAFLGRWLTSRTENALINFGASVRHGQVRAMAMERYAEQAGQALQVVEAEGFGERLGVLLGQMRNSAYESLRAGEMAGMLEGLTAGLAEGGLGIGVPVDYYPGATREEIFSVYAFAADRQVPVFTHVRDGGIVGIQEALANAAITGAPLHIVHVNSMALGDIGVALEMVETAQRRGLDITTELYPYTAGSTGLESAVFDEGWQDRFAVSYEDLQWEATGERLTEETFRKYREEGGKVIIHMMKEEWIEMGLRSPVVMIGSDGMAYAPGAHPRSAGTFARVLGRYVREIGALTLMDALGKMTIRPAERLEDVSPSMRSKGRIQVGADADITVFDPDTIIDTATFEEDLSFSEGVHYVLVNGTFVVKDSQTVSGAYPGRPVVGRYKN